MKITFCGATERVTGSNFLVTTGNIKFLIDCGLFQGDESATRENWQDFLYDPTKIDFIAITHSHIDHIGRLPLLYKRGFRGKVYATRPTAEFSRVFLEDTYRILADKAREINLEKLYEYEDVQGILNLFEPIEYHQAFTPNNDISIQFYDAGHILGSSIIEIKTEGKILVFSGDLGNPPVPILRDTEFIEKADFVVMESTYGDRVHDPFEKRNLRLERIIEEVEKNKGVLLMPSFAMERTQEIIYEINDLLEKGCIGKIPVFVDSPLAIKATEIYKRFPQYFDPEAKNVIKSGTHFFNFSGLKFTATHQESEEIERISNPKIIIAGSGMSTGGRILGHEKRHLGEKTTTLLTIGFQVRGTLGRAIQEHTKSINIQGQEVFINAKIESIESYSAHADQPRLLYWLSKIESRVKKIFLVHGEPNAQDKLMHKIQDEQGTEVVIAKYGESVELAD